MVGAKGDPKAWKEKRRFGNKWGLLVNKINTSGGDRPGRQEAGVLLGGGNAEISSQERQEPQVRAAFQKGLRSRGCSEIP